MSQRILAIDPGSVDLGIAVYENAVLIHSERIAAPDIHSVCPLCAMPCSHASDPDLVTWYATRIKQVSTKYKIGLVISEMPVVFAKSGGGSQLLLLGAIIGGHMAKDGWQRASMIKWHGKPSIRSSKRSGSAHHAPNKERTDDSRSLENQRWRLSWQGGPNEQVARAATD